MNSIELIKKTINNELAALNEKSQCLEEALNLIAKSIGEESESYKAVLRDANDTLNCIHRIERTLRELEK